MNLTVNKDLPIALPVPAHQWGFPVSKETARQIFCRLGEDWWKQIYDGKYHQFGKLVFDEGLHREQHGRSGAYTEPGYLASAKKAFDFALEHLCEKPSVEFYCKLHQLACSHFKGKENGTEIQSEDTGIFRSRISKGVYSGYPIKVLLQFYKRTTLNEELILKIHDYAYMKAYERDKITELSETKYAEYLDYNNRKPGSVILTRRDVAELDTTFQQKVGQLKEYVNALRQDSRLGKAYPRVTLKADINLGFDYAEPHDNFSFEEVIPQLFAEFNLSISEIDAKLLDPNEKVNHEDLIEKKLILIADLYQKLEWFHPFPDGQGRTDVIDLGKLLAENGFNPPILDDPYASTYSTLSDWVAYLKEGMQKWRKLAESHQ